MIRFRDNSADNDDVGTANDDVDVNDEHAEAEAEQGQTTEKR